MTLKLIGLGESLGAFLSETEELQYGIRTTEDVIKLDKSQYDVWQIARMAMFTKDQFPDHLRKNKQEIQLELEKLKNHNAVIEWPDTLTNQDLKKYCLLSIGYELGTNEKDEHLIVGFVNASPIGLSDVPHTIWSIAGPIVTLNVIEHKLMKQFNFESNEAKLFIQQWVPVLLANGIASLIHSHQG